MTTDFDPFPAPPEGVPRGRGLADVNAPPQGHPVLVDACARVKAGTMTVERAATEVAALGSAVDQWNARARVIAYAVWGGALTGEEAARRFDAALAEFHSGAGFWSARQQLTIIREAAVERMAAPWAVFGAVLAHVAARVPPWVVLPPIVGGAASLNVFVALAAPSGGGKDAAQDVARDLVKLLAWQPYEEATPGTGEGLIRTYAVPVKGGGIEWRTESALFYTPEIDTLRALMERPGATLHAEIRKAWTGSMLGFGNAEESRRIVLPAHSYRMAMVVGAQPLRADLIANETAGGTAQRFLWFAAVDQELPEPSGRSFRALPAWPHGRRPVEANAPGGRFHMGVSDAIVAEIRDARLRDVRRSLASTAQADGHGMLLRLKVAALLAILDGRLDINDDDWRLAGIVKAKSDETLAAVRRVLADAATAAARERGARDAEREAAKSLTTERMQRAEVKVRELLAKHPEGMRRNAVRSGLTESLRPYVDHALARVAEKRGSRWYVSHTSPDA